ncbi:uncharacterized protein [Nicotiana sylvestris]|uniref:uncharacterized protein n=1 Tax=Nicotiana sylvestris TaxID=4096 RepID=UPI00388C8B0D
MSSHDRADVYPSQITEGFPIRGVSTESITASRLSLERDQEIILSSSSKRKGDRPQDSEDEEERDESSLVRKLRARRRVISDDEVTPPPCSVPMTEPVEATLVSSDEDTPMAARDSTEHLFSRGFDNEGFDLVSEEVPLASFPVSVPMEHHLPVLTAAFSTPSQAIMTSSTVPAINISRTEIGSLSGSKVMNQITIEVPTDGNLLKKSGQADVWLEPLIGPVEKSKLESHSSLTLMNDIVQSSLKINLIGTEIMKRVFHTEQLMHDYQIEADNWKEQYESLHFEMEVLEENKCTLEQQLRVMTSELTVEKASSNQAGKDKNLLELSFAEYLSKSTEEIRGLKALLNEKEVYATEREELKSEINHWERDYEALEDKAAVEVSWAILNMRHDTLMEVSQEGFNLDVELAKIKETIEKTHQGQSFSSPMVDTPENVEANLGAVDVPAPSDQIEPSAANDAVLNSSSELAPQ